MTLSEKELEDFIFQDLVDEEYPGIELSSRGFKTNIMKMCDENEVLPFPESVNTKYVRQLDLGSYGRLDVVGYCKMGHKIHIDIFELKVVPIESDDIDQICRYKSAIESELGDRFDSYFHMYLIGPSIESGHFIQNQIPNLSIVTYSYSLEGVSFEMHNGTWHVKIKTIVY